MKAFTFSILTVLAGVLLYALPNQTHTIEGHSSGEIPSASLPEILAPHLPIPYQYDPEKNRYWNPQHNHWESGRPKDVNTHSSEPKPYEYDAAQNRYWNPEHKHWESGTPPQPKQDANAPAPRPTPWQFDAAQNRHWDPVRHDWVQGPPPSDSEARAREPKPWTFQQENNRHWNPDHRHWHQGPPPDDAKKTADAKPVFPEFPLPSLQGKKLGPADYLGKVLLVNFWATWCGPCRKEIPDLIELYKRYQSEGVEVIGVAVDDKGAEVVTPFVANSRINYPVLIGSPGISATYSLNQIPVTLVLDRKGQVRNRLVGAQNFAGMENAIKPLLH